MTEAKRAGFVAVLGAPNAGKSSLVNRMVGAKVSIVSPRIQTTRTRIRGILVRGQSQIVFVDTPGIFAPKRRFDRAMVEAAWGGAAEADLILLLIDAVRGFDDETRNIVDSLKAAGRSAMVALNKIDLVPRPRLLPIAAALQETGVISEIFMLSARTGDGVDDLLTRLSELVPEGEWLYPHDQLSDVSERFLAAELVREKLFLQLGDELPYSCAVETEQWSEMKDGAARIDCTIYVLRANHKAIVLGKGGRRIKAIGEAARTELETMLGRRIHLFLFVKLREGWPEDPERYRALGLDFPR